MNPHFDPDALAPGMSPMTDTLFPLPPTPTPSQPSEPTPRGTPRVQRPNRAQLELRSSDLESLLPLEHRARIVWAFVEGRGSAVPVRWPGSVDSIMRTSGFVVACR